MKGSDWVLVGLLLVQPLVAAAGPLEQYLSGLESLQADFSQTLHDASGALVEESQGQMMLLRPGRFRWETHTPYRQTLVVDGERLWLYDPGLEQVSVQLAKAALAHTPAALLIEVRPVQDYFEVGAVQTLEDGSRVVPLLPVPRRDDYRALQLRFTGPELTGLSFTDALDQRVTVRFTAIRRSPPLAAAVFQFSPPEGVDVVELSAGAAP